MRRAFLLLGCCLALFGPACRETLSWPPPSMDGAVRVIDVPATGGVWLGVPTDQDCEVRLPSQPVTGMIKVSGCHDIKLIGGEVASYADPCGPDANGTGESVGIYLTEFAGTAHVEGVKIHGRGFSDGMWLTSTLPASVGQVQSSWFGGLAACNEPASGYEYGWPEEHPNCFQTWAGPSVLRFDKTTCWTIYEGLNVDTGNWSGPNGESLQAKVIDVRRTSIHLNERAPNGRQCLSAWKPSSPSPTHVDRVSCDPGARDFPGAFAPRLDEDPSWWGGVQRWTSDRGEGIEPGEAGSDYQSPGYG
jgi:hypothetical protein